MRGNHLVREARRRAGLTQTELAERAGTTQPAIARLERGIGSPSLARISELVEACGFEVQVRLVPMDDHDRSMATHNATLGPDQRLANALGAIRFADALRAAGERDRQTAS